MPLGSPQTGITGVSSWKAEAMFRANRVNQNLTQLCDIDFYDSSAAVATTGGTGAVTYDTGITGGVAHLSTGATINGYAMVSNMGAAALIGDTSGQSWYAQGRSRIITTPTADSRFHCTGVCNAAGATDDWVAFGLMGDIDDTYMAVAFATGGVVVESHVLSQPPDLTAFHDYGIGYDADQDAFFALLDGTDVLEISAPANLSVNPSYFYSYVINTGATDFDMYVDNICAVTERA